ncbi:MAG TPA: hypothetical protein VM935_07025 [Chitinophagaceae bacterium]|nr:hypothetical protein [Chitinophagaceae bacterium]
MVFPFHLIQVRIIGLETDGDGVVLVLVLLPLFGPLPPLVARFRRQLVKAEHFIFE